MNQGKCEYLKDLKKKGKYLFEAKRSTFQQFRIKTHDREQCWYDINLESYSDESLNYMEYKHRISLHNVNTNHD